MVGQHSLSFIMFTTDIECLISRVITMKKGNNHEEGWLHGGRA